MIYLNENNVFHLQTKDTSYVFRAMPSGQLESLYYGKKIKNQTDFTFLFDKHDNGFGNSTARSQDDTSLSLDNIPLEFSAYGKGDYRVPAMQISTKEAGFTTDFLFKKAAVSSGKPTLEILPSSYGECQTLTVIMEDNKIGAELIMFYTVFEECNVITRSVRLHNKSDKNIHIKSIMSMQIDLPMGNYTALTFDGAWVRERHKHEHKLTSGEFSVGSITGASSNRHNPFFIIERDECGEQFGECYGFNLVYSGNHIARTEISSHGLLRVQNGINPFEFDWLLKGGKYFDTPESIMTFSAEGLDKLSGNMHTFVKEHIVRGYWQHRERPIVVNNWEATYMNFNEKKILEIAKEGASLGAELFVLDDGWFGKRNNDHTSLGDWYVNKSKLPAGIDGLARKINALGMKFGLWVEPEMISPKSDLYKAHPDWAIKTDIYTPSQGRNQLTLDLTRDDVCEYVINTMTDVFRYGNISYIKWDYNRKMSDVFSHKEGARSGEFFHRYILGLYKILSTLTERFPEILFESCASGGDRFDLGMFCFMPQCWTSDDTDALERIKIQQGTSYGYPQSVMTMHVADSPNSTAFRYASVEERFNVAAFGLLGYELDVTKISKFDRAAIKKQIEFYKEHRALLQFGSFHRIGDPFKRDNTVKWQIVSEDGKESILGYFTDRITPNSGNDLIRFTGLDEDKDYSLKTRTQLLNIKAFGSIINAPFKKGFDMDDGKVYDWLTNTVKLRCEKEEYECISGAALVNAGFKPHQRYASCGFTLGKTRLVLDTDSRLYVLKEI